MTRRDSPPAPTGGAIAWMAKNHIAANLMMLLILAGGALGLSRVKQEVFPEFDLGMVTVTVAYPGSSPAEVEQGIVLAIEEAVRGIDGVKRTTATASEGSAVVMIELQLDANGDKVLADVKSAVDRIQSFPEQIEKPLVSLAAARREVISLVLSGDQDRRTLHELAERARADLLALPEITQVDLVGLPPLEISIEVPQATLEAYGLTLDDVAAHVHAASVEIPGGAIKASAGEVLVRMNDRRRRGADFADVVIRKGATGGEVHLGDIATIIDGYADTDQASFYNGRPAVRLTVYRVGDETPAQVAAAVRRYADTLRAQLPSAIDVAIWADDSEILSQRMSLLLSNAAYGLILVFVVLALLLNLRLAFWVGLGIPVSFLGAVLLMPGLDMSINMISLFAFIITLGLVVDDAIVVGENIFAKIESGMPRPEAAIAGTREMAGPVTFSVLTTVAAFAPLFFVPGVMGKVFRVIPAVVIAVLLVSLLESFFILPAHLGHGRAARPSGRLAQAIGRLQGRVASGLERFATTTYRAWMHRLLGRRLSVVAAAVALLIIAVGLVGTGTVAFQFFPKLEGDVVVAAARLPYGSPLARTLEVRADLEASARGALERLGGNRILRGMFTRVGEGPAGHGPSGGKGAVGGHLVTVELNLVGSDEREVTAAQVAATWASLMPARPDVVALSISADSGPGAGAPLDVQLSHSDIDVLARASADLERALKAYPTLTSVDNAFLGGKPQLDFHLLPAGRMLGLSSTDVARQLRASFYGTEALREQRGRNELKVMARLPEADRRSEYNLEALLIRTPAGDRVPLAQVASLERSRAYTAIEREEGRRVVDVSAELAPGVASARATQARMQREDFPRLRASYPGLGIELVGQQREQRELFAALGQGFLMALLVIFALLAVPFRSYVQPLIIMAAIPFGIVGAVIGHLLLGYGMSMVSLLGVVALSGVVVNDSLVLIDAVNRNRASGMSVIEAAVQGGIRRMRPILLTSLTTFIGLAPMILETSMQARFLIPMAISLGFGVLFSTALTLVLVPALYVIVDDAARLLGRARAWVAGARPGLPLDDGAL